MTAFFNGLIGMLKELIMGVAELLPKSPFQWGDIGPIRDVLGYVNYFIPIDAFVRILTVWMGAVTVWYLCMLGLRWGKVIE